MQKLLKNKPVFVDTDTADPELKNNSARYLKNYRANFNKNSSGVEGGNFGVGTPIQSNSQLVNVILPDGINHTCGGREFEETNEFYFMNWNSNAFYGVYRINGDTLKCDLIKVDPILNFSIDPKNYISADRIALKVIYITDKNGDKVVFEKYLIFTDGYNWQFWINVESAIATNGFDSALFPYYKSVYPHFDKTDLIQYAPRPPMFPATYTEIPYSPTDSGKENHLLEKSTQIAYRYIYTDGRSTALSAYSEPFYLKEEGYSITGKGLTRCLKYKLYAGGPLVEKIQILRRTCNNDFVLYDTLDKFSTCDENSPDIIQGKFWNRVNPFESYNYNSDDNSIEYTYCGDKECTPFDNTPTGDTYFQTSLPIKSVALADAGDAILMANNLKFYNNFSCETLKNLKINVLPPGQSDSNGCAPKTVKISTYAYIREGIVTNQVVYHDGADTERFFGGMSYVGTGSNPLNSPVEQTTNLIITKSESVKFNLSLGQKDGFIGYLCGTPYYAIGEQYAVDSSGILTKVGVIDRANATQMAFVLSVIKAGGYFVQRFDFTVPAGNYLFRIAGHRATVDEDYSKSSTYVMGVLNRSIIQNAKSQFQVADVKKDTDLLACDSDLDMWNNPGNGTFCIFTPFTNTDGNWRFVDGYFKESQTSSIGMEICNYRPRLGQNSLKISGTYTDANGFFFAYSSRSRANEGEVVFSFYANCSYQDARIHTNINQNGVSGPFMGQNINWADTNGGNIGEQNKFHLKGNVANCDTGIGISGVGVTLGSSQTFFTDGEGNYEIIFHGGFTAQRGNNMFFNAGGSYLFAACDCGCVAPVFLDTQSAPCISGQPRNILPNIDKQFKIISSSGTDGLKGGGMYGITIVGWDDAERATYANLIDYVDIPTFLETGVFLPSKLNWEVIGSLNLPPEIKSISFFISKNLNFKSYLQWVGDKIEFLDSTGTIVEDGSGAIRARITIQSLLDFNVENNFATTVGYQFVTGDSLRIYDDGNGVLFPPDPVSGFMDYQILGTNFNESVEGQISVAVTDGDTVTTTTKPAEDTDGKSFIIAYDSRLLKLKDKCSFWIELIRPKDCVDIEIYGEIPGKYPVENGEIMFGITSGPLIAYDTFYQNRNIKIEDCTGKAILHPFESSSITDFWGDGCNSFGRTTVKDPEVKQYWDQTEVTKSDEFVNNGRVNGIGTFRGKTSSFAGQKRGGIVAMHVETGVMAFVCENDIFVTGYNQKYVQAQANTGFIVVNLDNVIGEPNPKVGITHGCSLEDRATIVFEKELSFWFDRKNGVPIIFPYSHAQDIAQENRSYFINKSTHIINFNKGLLENDKLSNLIEICGGYDPKNNDYILTFRPRNGMKPGAQYFVNNEREVKIPIQETFIFNIDQKKWTNYTGYTPEYIGSLRSSISGKELITFAAGLPYFHNSILPGSSITFNEFYGVQTESVIDVTISGLEDGAGDKVKTGQSITVKSNGPCFFVDRITTDKKKAFTYIPLSYFKRVNNVWYSTILSDTSTYPDPAHPVPSQLIDGKLMNGLYFRIRFVMNPQNLSDYFEFDNIALRVSGVEKSDK